MGFLCLSLFCYALLCVQSSFAIILKRKNKLVALLLLSYECIVTIMCCGPSSRCRGLVCSIVITVFSDHTQISECLRGL